MAIELNDKEQAIIEKRRARAVKTEARKLARIAQEAVKVAQERADNGLGGPFSLKGYKVIPQSDGSVQLWRKGVEVHADLSVLAETEPVTA